MVKTMVSSITRMDAESWTTNEADHQRQGFQTVVLEGYLQENHWLQEVVVNLRE